jgi:DNA-binding Lrp family transcriptional regulator
MDAIDSKIVALLLEDGRRPYGDIATRVSLSAPAVKRRVDRLEQEGVILGYTAIVNPPVFGWHAEAFVDLYCDGKMAAEAIKQAVVDEPRVVAAHTVAGESSALLHVMAEDTKDLEQVLERIRSTQGVTRTVTEVVLSTLFQR